MKKHFFKFSNFFTHGMCVCVIAVTMMALPVPLFAQKKGAVVELKLASIVPDNTDWSRALDRLAKEWYNATNGQVVVSVYHGGQLGSLEKDVLRKLKGNTIQAAVFTSAGLSLIAPEVLTLSAPFFIRNDRELDYVINAVKSELEAKINRQYFMLAWAKSGWLKIFSRNPVRVPADLKSQITGTVEIPVMNTAFKSMGFQMQPIDYNSVIISLTSGKIDAVYQTPAYAAPTQLFGIAKNMTNLNIAPIMGGIVINQQTWRKIDDQYKPKLLAIVKEIEREIGGAISKLENEAVQVMTRNGLNIITPTPAEEQIWYNDVGSKIAALANDKVFNRALYNKIDALLQAYRK
ncbi:MAG: TRAP transporter substrate-binding protein DctP [Treponema sp.]|jgi:TRAP-type C4-dicarboxylate transport system substrate-binding protein|nr:TRAP transporter substrate-binding protein DctP [Treponema sp.]